MLGHLVVSHATDDGYRAPQAPGWMRRVLMALFARKR